MTPDVAIEWLAWATQRTVADVAALGLGRDQLVTLAGWLAARPLLNPYRARPLKTGTFRCACCGKPFVREYRTNKPVYCGPSCRQKAYRKRKRDRELAALEAQRTRPAALVRKPGGGFKVLHASAAEHTSAARAVAP